MTLTVAFGIRKSAQPASELGDGYGSRCEDCVCLRVRSFQCNTQGYLFSGKVVYSIPIFGEVGASLFLVSGRTVLDEQDGY